MSIERSDLPVQNTPAKSENRTAFDAAEWLEQQRKERAKQEFIKLAKDPLRHPPTTERRTQTRQRSNDNVKTRRNAEEESQKHL